MVYSDGLDPRDAAGGLVVADGRIVELLRAEQQPDQPVDEVRSMEGLVLVPGLINTHHHCYQTLTRAFRSALDKPLFPWLQALYPLWAGLTDDMVESATELALLELLQSGATTVVDHHYVVGSRVREPIDRQIEVARRLGVRVVLTRGSMSLGERDGGLPPDWIVQSAEEILDDSARLLRAYHDPADAAMVQIALAPCSPFSVTRELLEATATLAAQHRVLLHTHLAETLDEEAFCLEHHGVRPLAFLEQCGWLNERAWFAHGIHFTDDEIAALGAAGAAVSHCPTSNMMLSSGLCRVADLEAAGAPVSLGVDGSASNDGSNLMQEVRQAFLLQRLRLAEVNRLRLAEVNRLRFAEVSSPAVSETATLPSHLDALRWATRGGAETLRRPALGHLGVGACADIACFDLDELRFSGADDPLAALVLCGAHRARHVMINGQWRLWQGEVAGVDIAQVQAKHEALAAELRRTLG
ncbi:MAG: amidohydrolase family protein [Pseudomonadota bacterium]